LWWKTLALKPERSACVRSLFNDFLDMEM